MYIDGLKQSAKNEKELNIYIQEGKIYNQDLGMAFGIENALC